MKKVLLLCSSTDGQTRKICDRLRRILQDAGNAVTLAMIEDAHELSPVGFDLALVGARIRYGRTDSRVLEYVSRHATALNAMPSAYFSVNLVARKPGKDRPDTNPYVQAFLRRVAWRPQWLEVFAGKLDCPRYAFWDRMVVRLIMSVTQGPTAPDAVVEFTDWKRVDAFGHFLSSVNQPALNGLGMAAIVHASTACLAPRSSRHAARSHRAPAS
jgi:menaquinone-dependent protoporphyrinogen oxidase